MTPEGEVKRDCRKFLDTLGYRFSPVQMGMGKRTLDDLCCIRGRFVAIEYKRPNTKKVKKFQDIIGTEIVTAGGVVLGVRSLDEMKEYLWRAGLL